MITDVTFHMKSGQSVRGIVTVATTFMSAADLFAEAADRPNRVIEMQEVVDYQYQSTQRVTTRYIPIGQIETLSITTVERE